METARRGEEFRNDLRAPGSLPELHRLLLAKGALQDAEVRDLAATLHNVFAPRRSHVPRHA